MDFVRVLFGASPRAIEVSGVGTNEGFILVDSKIHASIALQRSRTVTSSTFRMTAQTCFVGSIDIMICGTFGRTLLILNIAVTYLANLTVKTITCTFFALMMTRSTQGLAF